MSALVLQEAELEDFLFAGNANDITGFGREDEEHNERSAVAELIAKVRERAAKMLPLQALCCGLAGILLACVPK